MGEAVEGGGVGSAALQLLKVGLDVHVYEQAPRIVEIGAGIQISPNASRLLHRLGLKAAMDAAGLYGGPVRPPLLDVSPADREHIARLLAT